MAKARTKHAEDQSDANTEFPGSLPPGATDFDPVELERQSQTAAVINQVADSTRMPSESPATAHIANPSSTRREPIPAGDRASTVKRREYKRQPDPTGMHTIALSDDAKGPKARLLRSQDHNDMWIQFSENPGEEIRGQLKDAGLQWEPRAHSDFARGAWVIPLEEGKEWRNHAHAEQVFMDIVNQIRAKNGMEDYLPMAQTR